ncbi:MAG TPA: hypothetical protein VD963_10200 [Phycisphaerales bacterium]|nr:hypothetical protein [Phycisphaerales bacterium]
MADPRVRQPRPEQRLAQLPPKPTAKPRKVYGGVKLRGKEIDASSWAAQRWVRLAEQHAPPEEASEGLAYARLGQARSLDIGPGAVLAKVQGRMPSAYTTGVRLPVFEPEQWERVLEAMTGQARYTAGLLAGEVPAHIEEMFAGLGLRLFPDGPQDLGVSCTCAVGVPWCRHVCCVLFLLADRTSEDPLLIFTLRGMEGGRLLERLRQRRSAGATGPATESVPVYLPEVPGLSDTVSRPLEEELENFWTAGPGLAQVDLAIAPPEIDKPLLRRLGPSPFPAAKFPLIGLLSTCYELVGRAALAGGESAQSQAAGAGEPGDETDE